MSKSKMLTAYLAERQPAPFSWPGGNCGHFGGRWVARVEGFDPMADLPVTPSRAAARKLQHRRGGMLALVTRQLNREPISPAFARTGDLVLLPLVGDDPEAKALGICAGGGVAAFVTAAGPVAFLPVARAEAAWRIGA